MQPEQQVRALDCACLDFGTFSVMQLNRKEVPLFDEDQVRVTTTWLTLGDTSHAIRTLKRVRLLERAVPRGSWAALFFVSLVLIVLAVLGLEHPAMPLWLGWGLLVASVVLCLCASWFAFVAQEVLRLDVTLDDGSALHIERVGRRYMTQLERALRQALAMQITQTHNSSPVTEVQASMSCP